MATRIHPTAMIEEGVKLGDGTSVWDHAHIRHSTTIGEQCIVGGKSYIAYEVTIGNRCKINSAAYICNGVTLEDGVMISAGVIFTNDRFPRAASNDLSELRTSDPDEHTLRTMVRRGVTIGAGAIIGCDLEIGEFAMVGMGSIVTSNVKPFHLVIGSPARSIGCVCRCGQVLKRWNGTEESSQPEEIECPACGSGYSIEGASVSETSLAKNP